MKRRLHTLCILLTAILLLSALGGCRAVDKGLLSKTVSAFDELETLRSVGWRRETYLCEAEGEEGKSQSTEIWIKQVEEVKDWHMVTCIYGGGDLPFMENAMAQRDGVVYHQMSGGGPEVPWTAATDGVNYGQDTIGAPKIDLIGEAKDLEFFRKEKDGNFTFAYSQAGLDAYRALLVEETQRAEVLTEVDGKPLSEEQVAAQEQSRAYNIATWEQTKITAISGTVALDKTGNLLRYQLQFTGEAPELEPDGEGGWTVISTRVGEMRTVIEVLAHSATEVEQKLAELFADLPK